MLLHELISRGYFPKELPRPFTSEPFGEHVKAGAPMPADWAKVAAKGVKVPTGKAVAFSLARGGLFRRPLSVPNPLHYYLQGREIAANWTALSPLVAGTTLSATAPTLPSSGRAIEAKWPPSSRNRFTARARVARRFALTTDVSRFYQSIYTHSIPWAIHTKARAKTNKSFSLWGNKIDYWMRLAQDGQTIGIPIGPDLSFLIAELIMQRCDEALIAKIPGVRGFRFLDDYELSFASRGEAEDAYHILERCLSGFELSLNPKKTYIQELPLPVDASWVTALKQVSIRSSRVGQMTDLESYFSIAFSQHKLNPDDHVLQFAIARLRGIVIAPQNWGRVQRLLLQCVIPEPASYPYVLEQIYQRINVGYAPLRDELEEVANLAIEAHAKLGHSSELSNALWSILALDLRVHAAAVDLIGACDDSSVALLALDCQRRGLVAKPIDTTLWRSRMTTADLYDDHWLLAYEANFKGWLPSVGGVDHVAADPNFSHLKAAGIYFYDESKARRDDAQRVPLPSLPTISRRGVAAYFSQRGQAPQ